MSISFECSGCGRTLKVADELAGRKAKCPQCQTILYIPAGPAAAVTPARRSAPSAPPPQEYDDPGAPMGDEPEPGPRRRRQAKKSMLVPLLIGGIVLLVLVAGATVAAIFVVPMIFGAGGSDDLAFMPDGAQMVGQVRVADLMNSDAIKQVWAAFPDQKKQFDQTMSAVQTTAVNTDNIERVYIGSAAMPVNTAAAMTGGNPFGSTPPNAIGVIHFKQAVKVGDVEDFVKKFSPTATFNEAKVGKYTMIDVVLPDAPAPAPPQPQPPKGKDKSGPRPGPVAPPAAAAMPKISFVMPDDKKLVIGLTSLLKPVLERDKAPTLSDHLQAAIKQADWNATIVWAVSKEGLGMPAGGAPGSPAGADKTNGMTLSVKVGADVDVNATMMCQDADSAKTLASTTDQQIKFAKQMFAGNAAPEVADLMNITPQANGSNVTIQKTIKVAPLLKLAKSSMPGGK